MIEETLKSSRGRVFGTTKAAAKLGITFDAGIEDQVAEKIDKNRYKTLSGTLGFALPAGKCF